MENKTTTPRNRTAIVLGVAALIIIAAALVICTLTICAWLFLNVYTARDTGSLDLRADYPRAVKIGETFQVKLYLQNKSHQTIFVKDIDVHPNYSIGPSILDHAMVISTDPNMEATGPFLHRASFRYSQRIRAGETQVVVFNFRATTAAETHTDFMIYLDNSTSALGYLDDSTTTLWDVAINIDP